MISPSPWFLGNIRYKMIIEGSCERDNYYCQSFTDYLLWAKHFLLPSLNFTVDTAIRAFCPYNTSHHQVISVDRGTTDYPCFPKSFLSDSLWFYKAKYLEDLNCFGPLFVDGTVVYRSPALESPGALAVPPRLHQHALPRNILVQSVRGERVWGLGIWILNSHPRDSYLQ